MPSDKSPARSTGDVVAISLDPAHRTALENLCHLTGRSAGSLLREGLDFVLSRYVPVEIKAAARGTDAKHLPERRSAKRVPTLVDSIDSPATWAARAVREAYVHESLAPDDPTAADLIRAAVAAAARHGFVVQERPRGGVPAAKVRPRRSKRSAATPAPDAPAPNPPRKGR